MDSQTEVEHMEVSSEEDMGEISCSRIAATNTTVNSMALQFDPTLSLLPTESDELSSTNAATTIDPHAARVVAVDATKESLASEDDLASIRAESSQAPTPLMVPHRMPPLPSHEREGLAEGLSARESRAPCKMQRNRNRRGKSERPLQDTIVPASGQQAPMQRAKSASCSKINSNRSPSPRSSNQVCRYFQSGYCKFGDKCVFQHPPKTPATQAQGGENGCQLEQPNANVGKTCTQSPRTCEYSTGDLPVTTGRVQKAGQAKEADLEQVGSRSDDRNTHALIKLPSGACISSEARLNLQHLPQDGEHAQRRVSRAPIKEAERPQTLPSTFVPPPALQPARPSGVKGLTNLLFDCCVFEEAGQPAADWCSKYGATSVEDIVSFGFVDSFLSALPIKQIPKDKIRKQLVGVRTPKRLPTLSPFACTPSCTRRVSFGVDKWEATLERAGELENACQSGSPDERRDALRDLGNLLVAMDAPDPRLVEKLADVLDEKSRNGTSIEIHECIAWAGLLLTMDFGKLIRSRMLDVLCYVLEAGTHDAQVKAVNEVAMLLADRSVDGSTLRHTESLKIGCTGKLRRAELERIIATFLSIAREEDGRWGNQELVDAIKDVFSVRFESSLEREQLRQFLESLKEHALTSALPVARATALKTLPAATAAAASGCWIS